MRHVRTRHPRTITDPETGRTYPVPQGGAEGDGDGGGDGEGESASTDGETPPADEGASGSDTDETDDESSSDETDEGAGSKSAVLADLKRERTRRQELEAEIAQLRQEHETDEERREREARERETQIREDAQAPALFGLRSAAVETAAREAGFVDPADAAIHLRDSLGEIDVELETATVDRDRAAELVTELAEAKPHLVTVDRRPAPAAGSDTQSNGGTTSTDPNRTLRELAVRRLAQRG